MLKNWILNIKNNSHYFGSTQWKYRVSGNLLELSVQPQLNEQKKEYRCAVITIGQILKALSIKVERTGSSYLIQSFPNLEAPEIIATIRLEDRIESSKDPFPILQSEIYNYSGEEKLRSITEKYQFDIAKTDLPFSMDLDLESFKDKTWFVLTSKHNNPFTWLNLGNWKESLQSGGDAIPNKELFIIFDFCCRQEWERINLSFPVKDHLQAVIAIPT